jgi:hypothetical protein
VAPGRRTAHTSLRVDARPQTRGRLDLRRRGSRKRDRPLLLGKQLGELRRPCDPCLQRRTMLGRK